MHVIRVPGKKKRMRLKQVLEKIMTENFLNLVKDISLWNQEAIKPQWDKPKEIYAKAHHNQMAKIKTKQILKAIKKYTYSTLPIGEQME